MWLYTTLYWWTVLLWLHTTLYWWTVLHTIIDVTLYYIILMDCTTILLLMWLYTTLYWWTVLHTIVLCAISDVWCCCGLVQGVWRGCCGAQSHEGEDANEARAGGQREKSSDQGKQCNFIWDNDKLSTERNLHYYTKKCNLSERDPCLKVPWWSIIALNSTEHNRVLKKGSDGCKGLGS